ncbi:hypothetical protein GGU10DRAFT_335435 [Lentinula aff. detonsa]|uniref:Uncharacterized protein n=1 Tax=Lentinula aff. detonsa TaxID=2804958 RepID=A0AA38KM40_9AGAR|nr:hypothetical protein GGU10DRAFT_335435 [Lentinula aff. detonsa]
MSTLRRQWLGAVLERSLEHPTTTFEDYGSVSISGSSTVQLLILLVFGQILVKVEARWRDSSLTDSFMLQITGEEKETRKCYHRIRQMGCLGLGYDNGRQSGRDRASMEGGGDEDIGSLNAACFVVSILSHGIDLASRTAIIKNYLAGQPSNFGTTIPAVAVHRNLFLKTSAAFPLFMHPGYGQNFSFGFEATNPLNNEFLELDQGDGGILPIGPETNFQE